MPTSFQLHYTNGAFVPTEVEQATSVVETNGIDTASAKTLGSSSTSFSVASVACSSDGSSSSSSSSSQTIISGSVNAANGGSGDDISLGWRNLRYEVTPPWSTTKRVILRRLNGHVRYHTMTGFMGPSGAGKTTLLNCLNGNIRSLAPGSELYVNRTEQKMPVCGFIEQHVQDTIVGRLTVREVLRFAYRFKNSAGRWCGTGGAAAGSGGSADDLMERHINNTLAELMLDQQILDRKFQQCSGGEQKRVAIAQELMSVHRKPELLFIDEPTTGLDSQAALEVMRCLRHLTGTYRITVLVSIHLPNDEILRMFDQLYILAKGGVAIYSGPPDHLRDNLRQQLAIEVDDEKPPVEEYLKIACHGLQDGRVRRLADQTLRQEYSRLTGHLDQLRFLAGGMPGTRKHFSIGHFILQLYRIFYMVFVVDFRVFAYQLLVYVLFFITIATVFDPRIVYPSMCYPLDNENATTSSSSSITCQQQLDDKAHSDSYITYQAFCVMFFGVIMLGLGSILFTPMLKMFRHEHRNGWYSMASFYWPFVLVRLLEISLFSLVITALIYFPTEHHRVDGYAINWNRLGHFAFFIWLSCVYMQTYGQLLSLVFLDRLEISIVVAQLWFIQLSMVNGYLINLGHINIPLLFMVSDLLATKPISKGLLYSFYGLDRCDPEREYSVVLFKFDVDPDDVFRELQQVWINIAVIRAATFALMYVRFSFSRPWVPAGPPTISPEPMPVDYETGYHGGDLTPQHLVDMSRISRIKHDKEQRFEQFSRNKIIVAWRTLNLFASSSIKEIRPVRPRSKLILRNLNGQFRFGTMNALMGTSGAGKTSLLKVLNGRSKTKLSEETRIYLSRYTPIRICFITQDVSGHLLPGLTAKQSLVYASRLKNSNETAEADEGGLRPEEHHQIAMNLLDELDIAETENTLVQHCSGGERKRLALALELTALRMPNLICIDEPTSGLDSNSAHVVVSCLRRLVQHHNLTIVASIHQPNTETLMMFDQCYVLARGGVAIYSGPPGHISQYLAMVPEIGSGSGESEFAIERLIKYSAFSYRDPVVAKLVKLNEQRIAAENDTVAQEAQLVADGIQQNRPRFSLRSVRILCHRYLVYMRGHLWLSWSIYIAIYLFYGVTLRLFFDRRIALTSGCIDMENDFNSTTCSPTPDRLQMEMDLASNYRYNFYLNAIFLFIVVLQTSLNFSKESIYFFNEHRNGWYSTGAYYLMKSLYDMLPMVPVLFIYVWTVNIYEPIRPGIYWYLLPLMMVAVFGIQGMGHMLALLTRGHFTILTITNIGVFLFLVMLSNFFNPIERMHYIYRFIANLSICRFLNEATILLQYGFGRCGPKEIQATLYVMVITDDDHFYHCIQMLFFNLLFYRLTSLAILVAKSNPLENRRQRAEKIRMRYQEQIQSPLDTIIPGLTNCDHRFYVKRFQI